MYGEGRDQKWIQYIWSLVCHNVVLKTLGKGMIFNSLKNRLYVCVEEER